MIFRYFGYVVAVVVLFFAFKDLQKPSHPQLWQELKMQQDQQQQDGRDGLTRESKR